MSEEKKAKIKKIQSTKHLRKIMADYFYELDNAAKEGSPKIAWCTSVGPADMAALRKGDAVVMSAQAWKMSRSPLFLLP